MPVKGLARRAGLLLLALGLLAQPLRAEFAFSPALPTDAPAEGRLIALAWSAERLFAAGERGLIAFSDDAGETWQQANVPVSVTLTALTFTADGTGWAVGHGGVILRGDERGEQWEKVFDGYQANEQFLAYAKANRERLEQALAELEASPDPDPERVAELEFELEDAVFALDDARFAMETGPADPFLDILFLDNDHGIAVGAYGMLYHTVDGGDSWRLDVDGIDNGYRNHLYSVEQGRSGRLYLSGEQGLLYYSTDRGRTWVRQRDVYDGSLFRVLPAGDSVYAMGLRGNLFRSDDRGESWQRVTLDGDGSLYAAALGTQDSLLLVGAGGRLVISRDGGASFSEYTHPSRAGLADVSVREGTLYLATDSGFIREPLTEFTRE